MEIGKRKNQLFVKRKEKVKTMVGRASVRLRESEIVPVLSEKQKGLGRI